jgi:hypothetical protein
LTLSPLRAFPRVTARAGFGRLASAAADGVMRVGAPVTPGTASVGGP